MVKNTKKILFIGIAESIHTARWIQQIEEEGFEISLFPSYDNGIVHKLLKKVNICIPLFFLQGFANKIKIGTLYRIGYKLIKICLLRIDKNYYSKRLSRYISSIEPHIIHSLETQGAGYLVLKAKKEGTSRKDFPLWWHTNWGSDIFLFGRLKAHKDQIKEVLSNCDYYSCECNRDVFLAKDFGFKGTIMPVYPNTGGLNLNLVKDIRENSLSTSLRKVIMLKGYQGWAGRSLVGIRALTRVKDLLIGYKVIIFSNASGEDVNIAAELLANEAGVEVECIPLETDHKEIIRLHSTARISIGLSISDAISTSVLEAMAVGSFPIQSDTSSADEWFDHGETGFLVAPEDPDLIEKYLRIALLDDALVDIANQKNWGTVAERLGDSSLKEQTVNSYLNIFKSLKN